MCILYKSLIVIKELHNLQSRVLETFILRCNNVCSKAKMSNRKIIGLGIILRWSSLKEHTSRRKILFFLKTNPMLKSNLIQTILYQLSTFHQRNILIRNSDKNKARLWSNWRLLSLVKKIFQNKALANSNRLWNITFLIRVFGT